MRIINKNRNQHGNSGFSLIEVMIAAGLLSVVIASLLQIHESNLKSHKTVEVHNAVTDMVNEIFEVLSDPAICTEAFTGKDFAYNQNVSTSTYDDIPGFPANITRSLTKVLEDDEKFRPAEKESWIFIISQPRKTLQCPICPENQTYKDGLLKINKISIGKYSSTSIPTKADDPAYLKGFAKVRVEIESLRDVVGPKIFIRDFTVSVTLNDFQSINRYSLKRCVAANYGRDMQAPYHLAVSHDGAPPHCNNGLARPENTFQVSNTDKLAFCFK